MHLKKIMQNKINTNVIIDCSHGNSGKIHTNQSIVLDSVMAQYDDGENIIAGVMIESNLVEGNQKLKFGCPQNMVKVLRCMCWITM